MHNHTRSAAFLKAVESGRICVADNQADMLSRKFGSHANVILHTRELKGDFNEVVAVCHKLFAGKNQHLTQKDVTEALTPHLSDAGRQATGIIIEDLKAMTSAGCKDARLRVVYGYEDHNENAPMEDNEHHFHIDGGDMTRGRILAPYTDPASEGLTPEDAIACLSLEKYTELFKQAWKKSAPDESLESYIRGMKMIYGGYYEPAAGKEPFAFRAGDIWRQAVMQMKQAGGPPAFVHRGSKPKDASTPRLLSVGS